MDKGIMRERQKMEFLKKEADYIIDTSRLLTRELKTELEKIFVQDEEFNSMYVTILSFGFKYGIPADADLVFDVRFLPNPFYIDELKKKTGNDKEVYDYVMSFAEAGLFLDKLTACISDSELCERGEIPSGDRDWLYRRQASERDSCKCVV